MSSFDENMTEQQRWYQIGKECIEVPMNGRSRFQVLKQIGNEYGYAVSSLKRLINYKNSIDRLRAIVPEAIPDILSGKLRLALANTIELSHRPVDEIASIIDSLADERTKVTAIFPERRNSRAETRQQTKPNDVGNPKEQRWYRIGKQFLEERQPGMSGMYQTSQRIGLQHNYSEASVRMFADFASAIDKLRIKAPEVVPDILAGKFQLSVVNTTTLSRKSPEEIRHIVLRLADPANKVKEIFSASPKKEKKNARQTTVKDVPAYDPDSHVIGLAYTIPSWVSQIDNAFRTTDFGTISVKAHRGLTNALGDLKDIAETMINIMMEEPRDESEE